MLKVVAVAIIAEAVWETLKMTWQKDKYATIDRAGSLLLGLLLAFATDIDILALVDIKVKFYVGTILTGILISRGSNFVHDLLGTINSLYQGSK